MEDEEYTKNLGCSIASTAWLMNHECIQLSVLIS